MRRWFQRNRTNVAVGAGILGAGYVAGRYVLSKVTETRRRMSEDRIAKENLRRRFEQNQEDCTITVLALLPTATENILAALPVESITQDLQQKRAERLGRDVGMHDGNQSSSAIDEDSKSLASLQSQSYVKAGERDTSSASNPNDESQKPPKSRAQLWNELKISSITRTFTLLYTLSLLTILTRIQLNLLGRKTYLSSVVSLASSSIHDPTIILENRDDDNNDQSYGNDFETNRKFLTFSWWLLHRGWREIMRQVEAAVTQTFAPLNPRDDVPLERFSGAVLEVRRAVEGATPEERRSRKWLPYLLPTGDEEELVLRESAMLTAPHVSGSSAVPSPSENSPDTQISLSSPLRRLLDETSDLIDSPAFSQTLTLLLDTTFSHLTDQKLRSEAYKLPGMSCRSPIDMEETFDPNPAGASAKLANILAVMTRQAHAIGNGVPNEYAQAMDGVSELEAFAAVVYGSHLEYEANNCTNPKIEEHGTSQQVEETVTARTVESGAILDTATGMFEKVWGRVVGEKTV
ncbi:MAG: hypothetical protein LQ342_000722 [Letrouitia transgressa]|nr:MAG: hypothetical protein LQ342_000722 [Letrouitia transgressa]